jgi:hypothetical protein
VDTRVLQIIYSLAGSNLPIYAGQQMDVFIDAPTPTTLPVREVGNPIAPGKHQTTVSLH